MIHNTHIGPILIVIKEHNYYFIGVYYLTNILEAIASLSSWAANLHTQREIYLIF